MLLFVLLPLSILALVIGFKRFSDEAFYDNRYPSSLENDKEKARYERGRRASNSFTQWVLCVMGAVVLLVSTICSFCCFGNVQQLRVIDQKVAVYEEDNARIEASVSAMVERYINYETDTFTKVSENISPTMVFSMYPELKSDAVVEKEISVYVENQKELRELKLSRYDYEIAKWWLWFG